MSEDQESSTADPSVIFVTNMKSAREAQGLGRKRFADQMQERGFNWHESVVPKVENQTRALKLGEAIAIAAILNMSVEELATQELDPHTAVFALNLAELESADTDLNSALLRYVHAQIRFTEHSADQPEAFERFAAKQRAKELGTADLAALAAERIDYWQALG